MSLATSSRSTHHDVAACTVDEEEDRDSDAEIDDIIPPILDLAKDSRRDNGVHTTTQRTDEPLLSDPDSPMLGPAPAAPEAGFDRRPSFSGSNFGSDSVPALSLTESPHLLIKRPSRRGGLAAGLMATQSDEAIATTSTTASARTAADAREPADWDDGSPPPRLSRSLSLSQASGPAAWSGGGSAGGSGSGSGTGCAKVTRASVRRRCRANSGSSPMPMPMLEMSSSLDRYGPAETVVSGVSRSLTQSRSALFGSAGGALRFESSRRRRNVEVRSAGDIGMMGTAPSNGRLSRSAHNLPPGLSAQGASGASRQRPRPLSLPMGLGLGSIARPGDRGDPAEWSLCGDPAVGWVLRAPGALSRRHRSQSFAGGRQGFSEAHARSASMSCTRAMPLSYPWSSADPHGFDGQEDPADGGQKLVLSPERLSVAPTQTPQASPSNLTSAARNRSNNLSSVARRMDRLDIGSPDDVGSQAAQV